MVGFYFNPSLQLMTHYIAKRQHNANESWYKGYGGCEIDRKALAESLQRGEVAVQRSRQDG